IAALGEDGMANNDFVFGRDTPAPAIRRGSGAKPGAFPRAMEGELGPVCPHAAHIFKVNPRDVPSDVGPDFDTLTRRILRRGIPFGPSLAAPSNGDDGVQRGLHFLCYQASIIEQFEFLQQQWANSPNAPAPGGQDLIIGQSEDGCRTFELGTIPPGQVTETITAPRQWVTPTGGGYFFAPSIDAIGSELARVT
ncbi:MAG: hypothetical protein WD468_05150, partial [Pirellulales bacterium]